MTRLSLKAHEKLMLVDIIERYSDVIECKKTDAVTNEDKKKAWLKVSNEFYTETGVLKAHTDLSSLWRNWKTSAKKYLSSKKLDTKKTGGGSSKIQDNELMDNILNIINEQSVEGLANPFDSDYLDDSKENDYVSDDWSNYNPRKLKNEISMPLKRSIHSVYGSSPKSSKKSQFKKVNKPINTYDCQATPPLSQHNKFNYQNVDKLKARPTNNCKSYYGSFDYEFEDLPPFEPAPTTYVIDSDEEIDKIEQNSYDKQDVVKYQNIKKIDDIFAGNKNDDFFEIQDVTNENNKPKLNDIVDDKKTCSCSKLFSVFEEKTQLEIDLLKKKIETQKIKMMMLKNVTTESQTQTVDAEDVDKTDSRENTEDADA